MENQDVISALLSLIFVISLIGLCAFVGKRFLVDRNFGIGTKSINKVRRLQTIEHLPLDARRRLVLVEKDGKEEILLLLSATGETVISITPLTKKK